MPAAGQLACSLERMTGASGKARKGDDKRYSGQVHALEPRSSQSRPAQKARGWGGEERGMIARGET